MEGVVWIVDYTARPNVPDLSVLEFADLLMAAYFSLDPMLRPGRIEVELAFLGRGLYDYLVCTWPEVPIVGFLRNSLKLTAAHCRTFSDPPE